MPSYFCLAIRFLQPCFHGRTDGGEPEWPPSPLRAFQALVAAAANRWCDDDYRERAVRALHWLERLPSATLVACDGVAASAKYRLYVPDNSGDLAAGTWSRGDTTKIIRRSEKDVRPTHLKGEAVHYLFPIADDACPHLGILSAAAKSITHLGWGIDMVVGDAAVISDAEARKLPGERWQPTEERSAIGYREPKPGTLDDLTRKHEAFLTRLGTEGFKPVSPLSSFRIVSYRRTADSPDCRFAAFSLLKPDARGFRVFETARRGTAVAGMLRGATKHASENAGWTAEQVSAFALGHREMRGMPHQAVGAERFAYIPLPSIEFRGPGHADVVGAVRRVMIAVIARGHQREIEWASRALSGADLVDEYNGEVQAILSPLSRSDNLVQRYTTSSSVWSTVTPIVLPGYDDRKQYRRRLHKGTDSEEQKRLLALLEARIDGLLRKAIIQAGFSEQLAEHAIIEWQGTGFWPGTDLATRYFVPEHLRKFPRYHVRIRWRTADGQPVTIRGPLCLGGGRYYGIGLLAAAEDPAD
jgi:CRISPR-associated protein Csb2